MSILIIVSLKMQFVLHIYVALEFSIGKLYCIDFGIF
jgi:hypothetical protein